MQASGHTVGFTGWLASSRLSFLRIVCRNKNSGYESYQVQIVPKMKDWVT